MYVTVCPAEIVVLVGFIVGETGGTQLTVCVAAQVTSVLLLSVIDIVKTAPA